MHSDLQNIKAFIEAELTIWETATEPNFLRIMCAKEALRAFDRLEAMLALQGVIR